MSEPPRPGTLDDVRRVIARQAKMLAVRRYREKTGAGPAEAQEAVERIGAGRAPTPRPAAAPPVGAGARLVGEALRAGNEIEAIRLYRAATGVGLEEAKAAIDAIMAEKLAGPRPPPPSPRIVLRRRFGPILVLLALTALFGSVFGLVILLFTAR